MEGSWDWCGIPFVVKDKNISRSFDWKQCGVKLFLRKNLEGISISIFKCVWPCLLWSGSANASRTAYISLITISPWKENWITSLHDKNVSECFTLAFQEKKCRTCWAFVDNEIASILDFPLANIFNGHERISNLEHQMMLCYVNCKQYGCHSLELDTQWPDFLGELK